METLAVPEPILTDDEVDRQKARLAELRAALTTLGIHSTPTNNRRLCLEYTNASAYRQSGLTAPTLHVFANGHTVVRMEGKTYVARDTGRLSVSAAKAESTVLTDALLADAEISSRLELLSKLQMALNDRGVKCVLARGHKLVLRDSRPYEPSGLPQPQLLVFVSRRQLCVTTDGMGFFWLDKELPVGNPAAAAAAICEAATSWSR